MRRNLILKKYQRCSNLGCEFERRGVICIVYEGLNFPKTMKILGTIGKKLVIVLIDSGATHNFISDEVVRELELPFSFSSSYGVVLGILYVPLGCAKVGVLLFMI